MSGSRNEVLPVSLPGQWSHKGGIHPQHRHPITYVIRHHNVTADIIWEVAPAVAPAVAPMDRGEKSFAPTGSSKMNPVP